jgi:hypothetical protein
MRHCPICETDFESFASVSPLKPRLANRQVSVLWVSGTA